MGKRLHDWFIETWYGDTRRGAWLLPLAALFAAAAAVRRGLYRTGLLRSYRSPRVVVVVGNLTVGGAGKTPLAMWLAGELLRRGLRVGIALRGYRGAHGDARRVEDGDSAEDAGDEAVMVRRRMAIPVAVGRERAAAVRLLEPDCDVIVCDDGLQHYALARDVEIEVIDGRRRYGNAEFLPAGPLREPVERAQRCDFRVVNLGGATPPAHVGAGFGEWPMRLLADTAMPVTGGRPRPLASFSGQRVHAVAGIGDPERFFGMLRGLGIAVVPHAFDDHHRYEAGDFEFGSRLPVLMTEKDAVKCGALANDDFYSVPVRAELPEAFWVALLSRLTRP